MSTTSKSWLATVVGLLLVLGTIVGIKAAQIRAMVTSAKSMVPPPEAVTSADVQAVDWEVTTGAVGSLVAVHAGSLGAELPGLVRAIGFDSGTFVKRGDVLVQLDTSAEEAQLAGAVADAALAEVELERVRSLRQSETIPQSQLDVAEARAQQTAATVRNLQATIAKKTIRAPFDGRIGIRQVELGELVAPGTAAVASLQSVTPIHADFWLPQQALGELTVGQHARMGIDMSPERRWEGQVTAINPEVDVASRNVRVRATFPNEDGYLRPGMFANVEVVAPAKKSVLIIPVTAVLFAPYGDSVFVLEKDGARTVARQRFVRLGARRGDYVVVESGLKAGESVVSTGAFKLHGDTPVIVNNALAPDAGLAPRPTDE